VHPHNCTACPVVERQESPPPSVRTLGMATWKKCSLCDLREAHYFAACFTEMMRLRPTLGGFALLVRVESVDVDVKQRRAIQG
jgi:hypothetical protein